jgi:hypothetical protein
MVDVENEAGTEAAEAWRDGDRHGDESGAESDGIFAGVLASYSEHGYERGYRRAVSDALALLLLVTEEYLRAHPDGAALRPVLYPFEEHVERHLHRLGSRDSGYVAGGLGI